jgi:hypothetical protein
VPEDGDQQRPGHGGQPHPEGGGQHRSDYSAQTPRDDSTESLPPVGMTTQIVRTGGAEPCHVCVHPALGAVVANYGSGSVAVIRLDANGLPLPGGPHQVLSFRGSGPVSGRQASAHAHFVFLAAGDSDTLLVSDLGSDKVRRCRIERVGQRLIEDGVAVELPAGTGPRHAVFSKDGRWLYVVGELDGRIHQVAWDGATASGVPVGSTPVAGRGGLSVDGCDTSSAEGFDGPQVAVCGDSPVEGFAGSAVTGGAGPSAVGCDRPPVGVQPSHLSRVGSTLIAGVRLADGLSMHRLAPDGSVGPGVFRALPGSNPRHHLDLPPWHLVALQGHGGVAVVDSDGRVSDVAPVPAPACIVTGVEIG